MLRVKFWDSIGEMPIDNYFRLNETNDIKWLVEKKGLFGRSKAEATSAVESIYQQIIDEFGISEDYQTILQLKQQICENKCLNALENTNFYDIFIEIKTHELKAIENQKGTTKEEIQLALTKFVGVALNLKELTIKQYFTYIKKLNEENSKQPN